MGQGSLPDWRRHTAPLESPATMSTCSCTSQYDCKQHILSIATLLSEMVVDVKRHHGKVGLAITQRKHVPVLHNAFFNGTDSASSRSRIPAQDAEACLLEQTLALPVREMGFVLIRRSAVEHHRVNMDRVPLLLCVLVRLSER